jgi:hypothetical protein
MVNRIRGVISYRTEAPISIPAAEGPLVMVASGEGSSRTIENRFSRSKNRGNPCVSIPGPDSGSWAGDSRVFWKTCISS